MRDDLTVLVQRIHPRADDFEIFEFFSQAGKVRDIRLIRDSRSNKSKGVGYVEFFDMASVMQALALNGIAFKGQPLLVQSSMAEKNRMAQASKNAAAANALMGAAGSAAPPESATLNVSELNPNVSRSDLSDVFSPFGELDSVSLPVDPVTGAGLGSATIIFKSAEDAKSAQQAIDGLDLAGKKIIVQQVQAAPNPPVPQPATLNNTLPNMTLPGMPGMAGMAGLPGMGLVGMAGIPGMAGLPGMAGMAGMPGMPGMPGQLPGSLPIPAPAVSSKCVLLVNMFDPNGEDEKNDKYFFDDLREDVMDEVEKNGKVLKCVVLRETAGHIKVKFETEQAAAMCVSSLNQRWFAGKQITASCIEESEMDDA